MKSIMILVISFVTIQTHAQENARAKIIGGGEIEISTRPFQVSIRGIDGIHGCGGSILSESWVITAAHCVASCDYTASDYQVAVGITELSQVSSSGQLINVQEVLVHPDYDPLTLDHDIAMLRLSNEVNYNEAVQPIRIINSANQDLINAGQDAFVSGWGITPSSPSSPSNHLMGVEVPIITNANADAQLDVSDPTHLELTNNMIATGYYNSQHIGHCDADSGGPLTVNNDDDIIYLIGLASWSVGDCDNETITPSIYANVLNYEDWIYGLMCQENVLINDDIHSDVLIESSNTLESSGSVNDDLIVDFRAGQQIKLSDGFKYSAVTDGKFRAAIGGNCVNTTNSNYVSCVEGDCVKCNSAMGETGELNIYPNPTSRMITLKFDHDVEAISSFTIFDINGAVALSMNQIDTNGEMNIDISSLTDGIYNYVLKSGNSVKKGKIIKDSHKNP